MTNETQARRSSDALSLLQAGYSPEEVETILLTDLSACGSLTALSDPSNVLLQEVKHDDTGE